MYILKLVATVVEFQSI